MIINEATIDRFNPITITLESQDEANMLYFALSVCSEDYIKSIDKNKYPYVNDDSYLSKLNILKGNLLELVTRFV